MKATDGLRCTRCGGYAPGGGYSLCVIDGRVSVQTWIFAGKTVESGVCYPCAKLTSDESDRTREDHND